MEVVDKINLISITPLIIGTLSIMLVLRNRKWKHYFEYLGHAGTSSLFIIVCKVQ